MPAIANVSQLLTYWDQLGMSLILSLLLVFAVVWGILSSLKTFGNNRAVHFIIAISIALLSLRLGFYQIFLVELSSRLAIGLTVLLAAYILIMAFAPDEHREGIQIGLYILGVIIFIIVLFNAFSAQNFFSSNFWGDWAGLIIGALFIIGIIVAVVFSKDNSPAPTTGRTS
jgi:uncharacterized membrane protein